MQDLPLNFNFILSILFFFFIYGCGVKGNPKTPEKAITPSFLDEHQDIKIKNNLDEHKK